EGDFRNRRLGAVAVHGCRLRARRRRRTSFLAVHGYVEFHHDHRLFQPGSVADPVSPAAVVWNRALVALAGWGGGLGAGLCGGFVAALRPRLAARYSGAGILPADAA